MEKQEILEKSRQEKEDEGVTYAENKGRRWGIIGFCLLIIAFIIYNGVKGLDSYMPQTLFWGYITCEAFGQYRVRRERKLLWTVIFGGIATVCWLACYVLRTW